jgi:hypothetical protein
MPPTTLRPCLRCGTPTRGICPSCGRQDVTLKGRRSRNTSDERLRRHILRDWRNRNGDICPGTPWCATEGEAHATRDLTVDHTIPQSAGGTLREGYSVMCRTANSRKRDATPQDKGE